MENDKLKEFIDQNRLDFESEKAPDKMWSKISAQLSREDSSINNSKKPLWYFISGIAASLLMLITAMVGYQIGVRNNHSVENTPTYQDYAAKEQIYLQEISDKMSLLKSNPLDNSIQHDLLELDAVYQELKAELLENQNGNSNQIIDALIKNYNTKIDILELILEKQSEGKKAVEDEGLKI